MIVDADAERCARAPDGYHCYCWYEQDEPCCHCGTTDPNLLIIEILDNESKVCLNGGAVVSATAEEDPP